MPVSTPKLFTARIAGMRYSLWEAASSAAPRLSVRQSVRASRASDLSKWERKAVETSNLAET